MNLFKTGLSAAFLITLFACGTSKNGGVTGTNGTGQHGSEHTPFFEDLAPGDSLFASIEKGYCFGRCPVYTMKIYNSGYVEYTGTANMELLGDHSAWLTKDQMLVFFDKANETGYFEMQDEYDNPGVTDLPSTTTSLVMGGKRKGVLRRYGYPTSIVAFEEVFNKLVASVDWSPGNRE